MSRKSPFFKQYYIRNNWYEFTTKILRDIDEILSDCKPYKYVTIKLNTSLGQKNNIISFFRSIGLPFQVTRNGNIKVIAYNYQKWKKDFKKNLKNIFGGLI